MFPNMLAIPLLSRLLLFLMADLVESMDGKTTSDFNVIFTKDQPGLPCHSQATSTSLSLKENWVCYLLKSTEKFTNGVEYVYIMTTWDANQVEASLQGCTFRKNNIHLTWQLPKDFNMEYIYTEVQLLKYMNQKHNLKHIIVLCDFDETVKLLNAASNCLSCDVYTWYVPYSDVQSTGVDLPNKLICLREVQMSSNNTMDHYCNTLWENRNNSNSSNITFGFKLSAMQQIQWKTYGLIKSDGTVYIATNYQSILRDYPVDGRYKRSPFLRVVTIIEPPYTMIHNKSNFIYDGNRRMCEIGRVCMQYVSENGTLVKKASCCVGFLMDLWSYIEEELDVFSEMYIVADGRYGEILNDTWVGMIGELVKNNADIAVASVNVNEKRLEVVDFSMPFLVGGLSLVTTLNEEPLAILNLKPFEALSPVLWCVTLATTLLGALIIIILSRVQYFPECCWEETIIHFIGLFFQRDLGGKIPYKIGFAVISISVALFAMVIMSTYTAVLTANYVSHTESLSVTGFKDSKITNPTSSFKYGTLANSAYSQLFRDSEDPVWNKMYDFMEPYGFTDTKEAFQKLERGELGAIIQDYYLAYHYIAKDQDCRLKFAGKPISDGGGGFALRKGSVLSELLTDFIIRNQGFDKLEKWKQPWFINKCIAREDRSMASAGIEYFGSVLFMLIGSIVLSGVICIAEVVLPRIKTNHRYQQCRNKPMKNL